MYSKKKKRKKERKKKKEGEERSKINAKSDYVIRECILFQTIETLVIYRIFEVQFRSRFSKFGLCHIQCYCL